MSDEFVNVLSRASQQQQGLKYLLIYYIVNPKIYGDDIKLDRQTDLLTFYPVGTYSSFSSAFEVLTSIMKQIEVGRFKIIHIGTSSTINNMPTNSVLNTLWDKLPSSKLEELHLNSLKSNENVKVKDEIKHEQSTSQDVESIEYLRDNFSNLCFNHYALERCDEQHQQILEAIELRKTNCLKYLNIHGNDDFDKLIKIYEERLPKRGEGHLVKFFTSKILNKVDGIPEILHKKELS